jgi:hypothetical protein
VCVRLNIPPAIGGAAWLDFHCDECTPTVLDLRPDDTGIICGLGLPILIAVPMLFVVPIWYVGVPG